MTDIADLYARCIASGFDPLGAMTFVEMQIEVELRAAIATITAGLSEDATGQ